MNPNQRPVYVHKGRVFQYWMRVKGPVHFLAVAIQKISLEGSTIVLHFQWSVTVTVGLLHVLIGHDNLVWDDQY